MKKNTATVSITVTPEGKVQTNIQSGFQVSFLEGGTPTFPMKIRGYDVLWKDGKKLGTVEGGSACFCGFLSTEEKLCFEKWRISILSKHWKTFS
jgi:hypothetical protein